MIMILFSLYTEVCTGLCARFEVMVGLHQGSVISLLLFSVISRELVCFLLRHTRSLLYDLTICSRNLYIIAPLLIFIITTCAIFFSTW